MFFLVWAAATLGGFVSKTFLADPITMVRSGYDLLVNQGFMHDIGMTVWRVLGGFALAAVLAVPLGVFMGAYKPVEAFFEPFVSFARYLPASAFIPLLILWAGIGEAQKRRDLHRFVLPGGADDRMSVGNTRRDLARRLDPGPGDRHLTRVSCPAAHPRSRDAGWCWLAWTYVSSRSDRRVQRHWQ